MNSELTLLFDLSEYQITSNGVIYWTGPEDLDSTEWLSFSILDKEGNLHPVNIALSARFSISRKSSTHSTNASDSAHFKTNGIYLSPLPISKPSVEDKNPWQIWLFENWEMNYWKAYHVIVVTDELIINVFTWEILLDNHPLTLPKHPNR